MQTTTTKWCALAPTFRRRLTWIDWRMDSTCRARVSSNRTAPYPWTKRPFDRKKRARDRTVVQLQVIKSSSRATMELTCIEMRTMASSKWIWSHRRACFSTIKRPSPHRVKWVAHAYEPLTRTTRTSWQHSSKSTRNKWLSRKITRKPWPTSPNKYRQLSLPRRAWATTQSTRTWRRCSPCKHNSPLNDHKHLLTSLYFL